MSAYYNERDPYAAQWLRNLIDAGHIAPGEVDERSITEISPDDLRAFTQCHFFAGIGVWSHALRRAGWGDDRPVWTGSCPCQPFSAAGQQKGFDDERHLWPVWFELIAKCRPAIVLGEQVASALDWLDLVSADMEGAGYAFGASDLCAAGFGGAHIRQRLYFVAHADDAGLEGRGRVPERADGGALRGLDDTAGARHVGPIDGAEGEARDEARLRLPSAGCGPVGLADTDRGQRERVADGEGCQRDGQEAGRVEGDREPAASGDIQRLADAHEQGSGGRGVCGSVEGVGQSEGAAFERSAGLREDRDTDAPMLGRHAADWLFCRDGKWRPVEPGKFPLADAAPARVGRLRAYGNALDAETAAQFCAAVNDTLNKKAAA